MWMETHEKRKNTGNGNRNQFQRYFQITYTEGARRRLANLKFIDFNVLVTVDSVGQRSKRMRATSNSLVAWRQNKRAGSTERQGAGQRIPRRFNASIDRHMPPIPLGGKMVLGLLSYSAFKTEERAPDPPSTLTCCIEDCLFSFQLESIWAQLGHNCSRVIGMRHVYTALGNTHTLTRG